MDNDNIERVEQLLRMMMMMRMMMMTMTMTMILLPLHRHHVQVQQFFLPKHLLLVEMRRQI